MSKNESPSSGRAVDLTAFAAVLARVHVVELVVGHQLESAALVASSASLARRRSSSSVTSGHLLGEPLVERLVVLGLDPPLRRVGHLVAVVVADLVGVEWLRGSRGLSSNSSLAMPPCCPTSARRTARSYIQPVNCAERRGLSAVTSLRIVPQSAAVRRSLDPYFTDWDRRHGHLGRTLKWSRLTHIRWFRSVVRHHACQSSSRVRTRPYGTVNRCSNRGRRHGTRDFEDFSLTPPAGRAGVGAVERRHPTWRSRLPAPRSEVIFAGVNSGALFPVCASRMLPSMTPPAGWPPAIDR